MLEAKSPGKTLTWSCRDVAPQSLPSPLRHTTRHSNKRQDEQNKAPALPGILINDANREYIFNTGRARCPLFSLVAHAGGPFDNSKTTFA